MRILAIDFGMRRMGLAVSDALGITAQGLPLSFAHAWTMTCTRSRN